MPDNVLVATTGRQTGSAESRRLRLQDHIPGVVYGHGISPISVTVERRELRHVVSGLAGMNTVLSLQVDGQSFAALIKEIQRHPVRRTVSHIDFLRVDLDEAITISVPIRLVGEAKAVVNAGGFVDPAIDHIEVTTTPNHMPNEILIDITDMQPGQVIHLSDVVIPAGSTALGDPSMAVVTSGLASAIEAPAAEGSGSDGEAAEDA